MISLYGQRGVGMVEVMVALLLLAIGVLGFAALQLRAVDATSEATNRMQATNLAIDLAERIRANQSGLSKDIVVKDSNGIDTSEKTSAYIQAFAGKDTLSSYTWQSCYKNSKCTTAELAAQDVNQVLYKASLIGMKMAMVACPGNLKRERACIYVAWGRTTPRDGNSSDACTLAGTYKADSQCVIMETY